MIKKMDINVNLSVKGCWRLVNGIQNGKTPAEIRERASIAEEWITANKNIDIDTYDDMMHTICYLINESYK